MRQNRLWFLREKQMRGDWPLPQVVSKERGEAIKGPKRGKWESGQAKVARTGSTVLVETGVPGILGGVLIRTCERKLPGPAKDPLKNRWPAFLKLMQSWEEGPRYRESRRRPTQMRSSDFPQKCQGNSLGNKLLMTSALRSCISTCVRRSFWSCSIVYTKIT